MSHAIHHVAFFVSNLFQQQHSKVIKPAKRLKSTIESTAKAALLFIYNHGKIIIIKQLRNIRTISTETLKGRLKQRENFWIIKRETLAPLRLNQDLN